MDRLGRVVLIAGKNGAGKTRLLGRITAWNSEKVFQDKTYADFIHGFWDMVPDARSRFESLPRTGWWRDDGAWAAYVESYGPQLKEQLNTVRSQLYELSFDRAGDPEIVRYVPRGLNIVDPTKLNAAQLQENATRAQTIGVSALEKNALARIQFLQNRWWNATHHQSKTEDKRRNESIERYDSMRKLVETALRTTIDRTENGEATIFGFPLGEGPLVRRSAHHFAILCRAECAGS